MPNKKTALEKKIYNLFKRSGFKVKHRKNLLGFELDIYAEMNDFKIICECKHEKSENMLWGLLNKINNINSEFKADKVILAIYGIEILGEDKEIASSNNILIWDEDIIDNLSSTFDSKPEEGKSKLLDTLGIKTFEVETNHLGQGVNG